MLPVPEEIVINLGDRWSDPLIVLTVIIALATFFGGLSTFMIWRATVRYSDTYYRPHLGVVAVHLTYDRTNKKMAMEVEIRNVGPIPAKNVVGDWNVLFNGAPLPAQSAPYQQKSLCFPQAQFYFNGGIGESHYSMVMEGTATLQFIVNMTYQGVSKKTYRYYEKYQYRREIERFQPIEGNWQ